MDQIALKMFNCPSCGPTETCFIHGEWVDKVNYEDMVFEMTRPDFDVYIARVSERSQRKPDVISQARILADVETYAETTRKFQCSACGKVFTVPKRIHDPSAVSGGGAALQNQPQNQQQWPNLAPFTGGNTGAFTTPAPATGINRNAIWAMYDSKFTEAELDMIITDYGEDPNSFSSKSDKIDDIIDRLY